MVSTRIRLVNASREMQCCKEDIWRQRAGLGKVGGRKRIHAIVIGDEAYPCHMALLLDRSRQGRAILVIHACENLLTEMLYF